MRSERANTPVTTRWGVSCAAAAQVTDSVWIECPVKVSTASLLKYRVCGTFWWSTHSIRIRGKSFNFPDSQPAIASELM